MPTIARSVMMGSVTGALAYSAASPLGAFVRTRKYHQLNGQATFNILTDPLPTAGCQTYWYSWADRHKNKQRLRHLQIHGTPLPGGGEIGILGFKGAVRFRY
jgi:hypothetical protein